MTEKDKIAIKRLGKIILWVFIPYLMIYKIFSKKNERIKGILLALFAFIIYYTVVFTSPDVKQEDQKVLPTHFKGLNWATGELITATIQPTVKPTKSPKDLYDSWVKNQFSAWDGSCRPLVTLLKSQLNDADSFEHVETKYKTNEDLDSLTLIMTYRAKNAFGAKILNTCTAIASKSKDEISIVSND